MKMRAAATITTLAMCLVTAAPAMAQMETREGIALQNQILELRRDVTTLQSGQGRAPAPSGYPSSSLGSGGRTGPQGSGNGEATTQLLERVDRLEDAIRQLNGRLEEADNARQRQGADLAKQIGDLQFKIDNGAASAPSQPTGRPATPPPSASQAPTPLGTLPLLPPTAGPATGAAPVKRTPELALQEGNAALARRDYPAAEASAREVLANSKGSPRGYDAQFLLAQAMMGQRNYPQAAVGYNDAYDRNKQGAHAQDSLVGLANSLTAINEKRSACQALDTLRSQFPTPRADIATRAAALRVSAGCR